MRVGTVGIWLICGVLGLSAGCRRAPVAAPEPVLAPVPALAPVPVAVPVPVPVPATPADSEPAAPLPGTATPAAELGGCEQMLRRQGANPQQLSAIMLSLAALGDPQNLRCWARSTPAGLVAVAQGGNRVAQVVLFDSDGHGTVVARPGPANPEVPVHHWLATPWSALPVGDLPPWSLDESPVAAAEWWRDVPFAVAADGSVVVHVAFDQDFCKGFSVFQLQSGRWRAGPGGGEGCLVGAHTLLGVVDLDGDGVAERVETVALDGFAGDEDQPAPVTLQPLGPRGEIQWNHPRVLAFFRRLWLGGDADAGSEPDRDEDLAPDLEIESADLSDCLDRLREVAERLHYGVRAQISPATLRAYAESQLGRHGQGHCWRCQGGGVDDQRRCRAAVEKQRGAFSTPHFH